MHNVLVNVVFGERERSDKSADAPAQSRASQRLRPRLPTAFCLITRREPAQVDSHFLGLIPLEEKRHTISSPCSLTSPALPPSPFPQSGLSKR